LNDFAMNRTNRRASASTVVIAWLDRRLRVMLRAAQRSSRRHIAAIALLIVLACGGVGFSYAWVAGTGPTAGALEVGSLAMIVSLMTAAAFYPYLRLRSQWLLDAASTITHDYFDLLSVLGKLTELRNGEAAGHNLRVTVYTLWFAEELGFAPAEVARAAKGALLHDVGKLAVPDRILQKPGPLTPDERAEMAKHVGYGLEIISQSRSLQETTPVVAAHHERYDGKGYPIGMKAEAIPPEARMFALVDVFDALTSSRSYKPAYSVEEALATMARGRGSHFDPGMFDRFAQLVPGFADQLPKDEQGLTELLMARMAPYLNHVVRLGPALQ
jgi:putative nucleotidyltransferase with HDIG domain